MAIQQSKHGDSLLKKCCDEFFVLMVRGSIVRGKSDRAKVLPESMFSYESAEKCFDTERAIKAQEEPISERRYTSLSAGKMQQRVVFQRSE